MIAVLKPSWAALIAVTYPPGPEPMMMTSKDVSAIEAPVRSCSRGAANAAFSVQSRYSCGDKLGMRGLSRQIHMQDQPLYQGNHPKRHEHLHRTAGFPEPLGVMNAGVAEAENGDQQRHEAQDAKPALEVTLTIAAPSRKAIED